MKPLSSAYAKKSFEVASTTVSSPAPTTSRRSLPAWAQLAWLWMIAFGLPVVPDEYSQNAGSSARVAAVACCGRAAATAASSESPGPSAEMSRVAVSRHAARCGREVLRIGDRQPRLAVADDVRELRRREPGVERDRDRTCLERAQKRRAESRRVVHQQADALAAPHAERAERVRGARHRVVELAAGDRAAGVQDRRAVAPRGLADAREDRVGGVQRRRHAFSGPRWRGGPQVARGIDVGLR